MSYHHIQRSPFCWLLYLLAMVFLGLGIVLRNTVPIGLLFPVIGILMLVLATSFHYLQVKDEGDRLSVSFGPLPLFRRTVRYEDIVNIEPGRTTILDGWGIHVSLRGGWVWNIWGRDCAVLRLQKSVFRIGTDDVEQLVIFLRARAGL